MIFCFGGDSPAQTAPKITPLESVWSFTPDGKGSGNWKEAVGPVSQPFPQGIHRPSDGAFVTDGEIGYYLGGWMNFQTTRFYDGATPRPAFGLLTVNFTDLSITNTSNGDLPPIFKPTGGGRAGQGRMVNIPKYGDSGILVHLGGGDKAHTQGFNNISIYDKTERKWYFQLASGDIPEPRSAFCVVGIQGNKSSSFEL